MKAHPNWQLRQKRWNLKSEQKIKPINRKQALSDNVSGSNEQTKLRNKIETES